MLVQPVAALGLAAGRDCHTRGAGDAAAPRFTLASAGRGRSQQAVLGPGFFSRPPIWTFVSVCVYSFTLQVPIGRSVS